MTRDRLIESIADIIGDKISQRRDIAFDAAAEIVDLPEIAALPELVESLAKLTELVGYWELPDGQMPPTVWWAREKARVILARFPVRAPISAAGTSAQPATSGGCEVRAGECERCSGTGEVEVNRLSSRGEFREDVPLVCSECGGTGKVAA